MRSRSLIKNFHLMRSDQIRSNDQVRSEQRSDRTGNSTKFDRISNQADQSMIGKMEQEIWSRKEICTKRDHDQKGRSTNVIKKFGQQFWSRNLIKKCDQEIWSRKSISNFDQDFWSESNFDRTSIQSWSIFGRSLIEFPSTYDRISVETSMKFEAILVLGAPKIDQKSVLGPSWGVPGRPSSARGRPGASPARSGGVPKASLERPLSTKWGNFDDRSPKKCRNQNFDRTLSKLDHEWHEFWIDFWANLIIFSIVI